LTPRTIALVTQDLGAPPSGVATLVAFLHRVLEESGRYRPVVISLATAARDQESVRLLRPASWAAGPHTREAEWRGIPFTHVGAWGSELEPLRYRSRAPLRRLLAGCDAVQFVVGAPQWAAAALDGPAPVLVWTASTTRQDRLARGRGGASRRAWERVMLKSALRRERRVLRDADTVFALSDYTRDSILAIERPRSLRVAPCGVDTDALQPAAHPSRDYLLSVARFSDPRKNTPLLLRAYARVLAGAGAPPLVLAGDPPCAADLALAERLGIRDHLRVLGRVSDLQLARLYRNAALFVLASDEEGLGIPVLEAMACGLPVISTDCGGPATAVRHGETGMLTPTGDAEALAAAIAETLASPDRARAFADAGRRRAEAEFSIPAVGRIFLDCYDAVLQQKANHSAD
jgi:glycosyltransferase involved in cell wall biosynthesis